MLTGFFHLSPGASPSPCWGPLPISLAWRFPTHPSLTLPQEELPDPQPAKAGLPSLSQQDALLFSSTAPPAVVIMCSEGVSSLRPLLQGNLHEQRDKGVPVLVAVVLGIPDTGGAQHIAVEQMNE